MKVTYISNACCIYESDGFQIITDPWLINGVFDGSWCHYPPLESKPEDFKDVDAIYLSHLHPDHYQPESLRRIGREIPIIILDDEKHRFFQKILNKDGFKNIISAKESETLLLGPFQINLFNPFTTHPFHQCQVGNIIDSAISIFDGKFSIFNANDNTLDEESAIRIHRDLGAFDIAQINYNAAGPYPSCFLNLSLEDRIKESKRILNRNLNHAAFISNVLKCRYVMPFAGVFTIGGKEHYKNETAGVESVSYASRFFKEKGLNPICLKEKECFDLKYSNSIDSIYEDEDAEEKSRYIIQNLSKMKYEYELEPEVNIQSLKENLILSRNNLWKYQKRFNYFSMWSVSIDLGEEYFNFALDSDRSYFGKPPEDMRLKVFMDPRLINRILTRKSHWNNVETGFHMNFHRKPNFYDPDLHVIMSFFHL